MLGGCVCVGADCAGAVVADPFGCPLVIGCVYMDPGDNVDDGLAAGCACTVFAGCLCVIVCAALGEAAAGACLCAAGDGCCVDMVPDTAPAFEPLLRFGGVCATITGAAHTAAHNRPSNRIQPMHLIMESSGARRFHLHYDCVAVLGIVSEYSPFPRTRPPEPSPPSAAERPWHPDPSPPAAPCRSRSQPDNSPSCHT